MKILIFQPQNIHIEEPERKRQNYIKYKKTCKQMKFLTSLGTLSLLHKSNKHVIPKMFPTTTASMGQKGRKVTNPYNMMQKLLQQGCEERAL